MRSLPLVAAVFVLAGCVQERSGVSLNEVPAPVMRTIDKNAPGNIHSIVREKTDGAVVYRAKVTSGGKDVDLVVDQGGELVSKKEK
jgi:hypothetical protein